MKVKWDYAKGAPIGHIPESVVRKCINSDTILSCSIKHSYEDNPFIPLSIVGDRGYMWEFKFLIREYFNVGERIEVSSILSVNVQRNSDWDPIVKGWVNKRLEDHTVNLPVGIETSLDIGFKRILIDGHDINWDEGTIYP